MNYVRTAGGKKSVRRARLNYSRLGQLFVLLFVAFLSGKAQGRFGQWIHTSWTEQQGAPSNIWSLAKSPDGYLWVGSADGLFRFDGMTFEKIKILSAYGKPVSSLVYELFAIRNGDIWIATADSVGVIHQGQVHLLEPNGAPFPTHVRSFAEDKQGQIWITSWNGLFRWKAGHLEQLGNEQGLPLVAYHSVLAKRDGTILTTSAAGVYSLKPGALKFERIDTQIKIAGHILEDQTGRIWVAEDAVHPLVATGSNDPMRQSSVKIAAYRVLFDPDGKLWIPTMENGLRRIEDPLKPFGSIDEKSDRASRFTAADGLTDNSIYYILQDESGTIWMGTRHGLDCFRKSPIIVTPFKMSYTDVEVRPGRSEDIWVSEDLRLTHATFAQQKIKLAYSVLSPADFDKRAHTITPPSPLFCSDYYSGVLCSYGSKVKAIRHPTGAGSSDITGRVCLDHNQTLWLITSGTGVFSYSDGIWKSIPIAGEKITTPMSTAYTGRTGTTWFAFSTRLMTVQSGVVRDAPFGSQIHIGTIQSIVDNGDHVWFGGTRGLQYFTNGRVGEIIPEEADALTDIREMRESNDGSLWVSTGHGVVHIGAEELQRAVSDASHKIAYQTLGTREGLVGHSLYSEELASDGSLWLVSHESIARIDLSQFGAHYAAPTTSVRTLEANGENIQVAQTVTLPPHTTNLKFRFVGIDLVDPEHVTYRYQLTNFDKGWQNNGAGREAMYTNLSPGRYEFHVLARNGTGVWSADNTNLEIVILPTWYQRLFVKVCALVVLLLLGWAFFHSRIRQAELAAAKAFDARLAERMRISAELHDTFLQTVQGSKMMADDALDQTADSARMRHALEKVSVWLGQAITEGRAALHALRVSTMERNHLAEFLGRIANEHCQRNSISVALTVIGDARDLHPIVRDEIARIAEEAIRNSCLHSMASQLSIELRYARDLSLVIEDNGIGIDPEIVDVGKVGHFGIQGMKERSARIRARITITSTPNAGTRIALNIPGDLVYRRQNKSLMARLRSLKLWPGHDSDSANDEEGKI
jgi:signal transduction histidine kinase/ligand-binding sensor domain-containing protein